MFFFAQKKFDYNKQSYDIKMMKSYENVSDKYDKMT